MSDLWTGAPSKPEPIGVLTTLSHAFQINPREVLGVAESASLSELHEAYRSKSKKYHPDVGGDEWAFRVLTRAYELLSTERVMGRADEEMRREESSRAAASRGQPATHARDQPTGTNPFSRVQPSRASTAEGQTRSGVRDQVADPRGLISIELLLLRYEMDGPSALLLGARPEDRNLSCNLSIEWPIKEAGIVDPRSSSTMVKTIQAAFRTACEAVPPGSASARADADQFVGLMSYASALQADEAFKALRKSLREKGYGVVQTIREVTIPREWQD